MRLIAILGLLPALAAAGAGVPADLDSLEHEAAGLIPAFQQQLLQTVQTALKAGGPEQAVQACQQLAPGIAAAHSRSPWTVGRTALRLRNPDNRADAWERQVLEDFARRQQAGEDLAQMSASAVVAGEYRYMKAIATGEPCLACHGQAIEPELAALIEQRYPNDQAQGFRLGELRGAFTLRRPLPEPAP
ncbi:Protein of unknown function [Pseudomonas benzenivorans]|nr:DUF3365 domain-containing protein [Pseudomonas benzenivorans]SDH16602.1 Protein of unknown function [Pseudomonas benzenivorans]